MQEGGKDIFKTIISFVCGEHDQSRREDFEKKIESNPEFAILNDELKGLMDFIPRTKYLEECDLDKEWGSVSQQIAIPLENRQNRKATQTVWRLVAASVSILMVVCISFSFFYNSNGKNAYHFVESHQHIEKIELPDGSTVYLNAQSSLAFLKDFGKANREVYLEGEAYFDIAKSKKSTFTVKTKTAQVESSGDKFSICAYREFDHVEVMVEKGKVLLHSFCVLKDSVPVTKGSYAVYKKESGKITLDHHRDQNYFAWMTGEFVFEETKLADVFNSLTHLYHVDISYDENIGQLFLTGNFKYASLDHFLKELKGRLPVEIDHHGDSVKIRLAQSI